MYSLIFRESKTDIGVHNDVIGSFIHQMDGYTQIHKLLRSENAFTFRKLFRLKQHVVSSLNAIDLTIE